MAVVLEKLDGHLLGLLQSDGKGWNCKLFINTNRVEEYKCKACDNICKDATELGCDHDDDDVDIYCKICLETLIKSNGNKCHLNSTHTNPSLQSSRMSRKQILKFQVLCPNSQRYQNNDDINNANMVYDTNDEKEGGLANNNNNNKVCVWTGTLNELINDHLKNCKLISKDLMVRNIEIIKQKINAISFDNENLKNQVNELNKMVQKNTNEISIKDRKISDLTKQQSDLKKLVQGNSNDLIEKNKKIVHLETQINKLMHLVQKSNDLQNQQLNSQNEEKQANGNANEWDPGFKCKAIRLTNYNKTADNDGSNPTWNRILGKQQCKPGSGIYNWKLKLTDVTCSGNTIKVVVGVCPKNNWNVSSTGGNYQYFYCFWGSNPSLWALGSGKGKYGTKFEGNNDEIDVCLDMDNLTLSYTIKGTNYGKAFTLPSTTYRLAVDLCPGRKINLV